VGLNGDNRDYRSHACYARIVFRQWGAAHDDRCDAGEDGDAQAYLREGMYFLLKTQNTRGGDQSRAEEEASRAFAAGLARVPPVRATDTSVQQSERVDLIGELTIGKFLAEYCHGSPLTARETYNSISQDQQEHGRQFFADLKLQRCGPEN